MSEVNENTEVEATNNNDTQSNLSSLSITDKQALQQYIQSQLVILSKNQIQHQQEMIKQQTMHQQQVESSRRDHERQLEMRRIKIDMIKVATDTLSSNAKSKPVDTRDITASDIKTFAEELIEYINKE